MNPSPKAPDGEGSDRRDLARGGETLPAAERLALLVGQLLSASLLAEGAARADPEVEVVEDLGSFFGHAWNL